VLDGTVLRPSTSFTKTWRVQNDGPCPWEPGTVLAFVSGHQMDGPAAVEAGAVAAGESTDLSVGLTAPALPGGYEGTWRLQSGEGDAFGPGLVVSIVVEAATATPPPACVALDSALEPILTLAEDAGHNPGCPIGPAVTVNGAIQLFETEPGNPDPKARIRGFMIWRADQEIIYALGSGWASDSLPHDGDVLHVYEDEWTEGMPAVHPDCASMSVLPGYRLPVRGFGRAWCENSLWEDSELGWPTDAESGVILVIQPTCNGVLMRLLAHPWGISWDFSLDIPGERWYSTATGP
jgi:hypothetical protein